MNKLLLSATAALSLFAGAALADYSAPSNAPGYGGFNGPNGAVTTVKAALDVGMFQDDVGATLTGFITKAIGNERYLFTDNTGSINIEIDHDDWGGLVVDPKTKVVIYGEIDNEFLGNDIEVHMIRKA